MLAGTAVINPSQYDDSVGVSTGTRMMRGLRPTAAPNARIMSS